MTHTLTATEARVRFGRLLQRVAENGETIVVERGGKPRAVVLSVAEYTSLCQLRSRQESWETLLDEVVEMVDHDLKGRTLPPAGEMIARMREERDAELLGLR
ncbi:MAG: type II toxin-antitoxin system Phd/YefM family antitoxin [bacterium]|nr:type II toxin-antitoxin system Phd/YefM family antitoxin [bacterium]